MKRFLLSALLLVLAAPAFADPTTLTVTVDHGVPLILNGAATSVFIANPDVADVQVMSPSKVMVFGKRAGETSFMATDSSGRTLAERTVIVAQDLSALSSELHESIPGNKIAAHSIPNGIVLTGSAQDPAAVADAYKIAMRYLPSGGDIINRIQVTGSNQVQIRVRFAEVQRSVDNTLGFNWQNLIQAGGGVTVGLATGATGLGSGAALLSTRPPNAALNMPNDILGGSLKSGRFSVDGIIDALAQEGLVTILAEPNLTAMSGETANFLAGGQFPIPIPQGNGTISIQFQSYGISLAFTPTLLSGNRISVHVRPEVSELSSAGSISVGGISVPALTTRKAETTVEVTSGQSFAIAGLLDNSQTQTINKFPLLGDMPIIGALFRSSEFQNGQTELVVVITTYIVSPTGQRLSLPTDGYSPPSEVERLVGLRTSSGDPDARPMSGAPAAVASPVSPVTAAPVSIKEEVPAMVPPTEETPVPAEIPAPVAVPAPAPEPVKPLPVPVPQPAPTPPLVLHPDADKHGGLLVE